MLKQIKGDLLKIESGVILHQVNCIGATGGLAGALRRKWPKHFETYLALCEMNKPASLLGGFEVGCEDDQRISIVHIFGQLYPGPNTDLEAVESALKAFSKWKSQGKDDGPIYAPHMMGCGLGGGNWSEYLKILESNIPTITIVNNKQ